MLKKLAILILLFSLNCDSRYYGQTGQDKFVNEHFIRNKKNGVFVDIGAHDGISFSNTYFFETELNWKGICFEPLSKPFQKLSRVRPGSICLNACVSPVAGEFEFINVQAKTEVEMLSGLLNSYDPRHLERLKREVAQAGGSYNIIKVPSVRFNDIMNMHNVNHINLLSMDTEGNELEILKSIDFEAINIDIILVENNYQMPDTRLFLESKGFTYINFPPSAGDEVYVKSSLR